MPKKQPMGAQNPRKERGKKSNQIKRQARTVPVRNPLVSLLLSFAASETQHNHPARPRIDKRPKRDWRKKKPGALPWNPSLAWLEREVVLA
jgi:hypothetical protein